MSGRGAKPVAELRAQSLPEIAACREDAVVVPAHIEHLAVRRDAQGAHARRTPVNFQNGGFSHMKLRRWSPADCRALASGATSSRPLRLRHAAEQARPHQIERETAHHQRRGDQLPGRQGFRQHKRGRGHAEDRARAARWARSCRPDAAPEASPSSHSRRACCRRTDTATAAQVIASLPSRPERIAGQPSNRSESTSKGGNEKGLAQTT